MNTNLRRNTRLGLVWLIGLLALVGLMFGLVACNGATEAPTETQVATTEPAEVPGETPLVTTEVDSGTTGDQPPASPETPAGYTDYGAFQGALLEAIVNRDYASLQSLMGDPFVIAGWQSEGRELQPAQAIDELRANYLLPTGYVYYELNENLTELLGGMDPLTMWGPDVNAVGAVRFTGWGADGSSEAIVIIAQRDDGTYYWHAVLLALGGFAMTGPNLSDLATVEGLIMASLSNTAASDYDSLGLIISDAFSVCGHNAGCGGRNHDEAITFIRDLLPPTGAVQFTPPGTDLAATLGINQQTLDLAHSTIHSSGWGANGKSEVLLMIDQKADGTYFLQTMIVSNAGFVLENKAGALLTVRNGLWTALQNHDYVTLESLMDGGLAIVGDPTGLYPKSAAVTALKDTYLLSSSTVTFIDDAGYNAILGTWSGTYSDLLGYHIRDCCGSAVKVVFALRIGGWGPAGADEAIMIIIEKPANNYMGSEFKWYGFLEGPF